MVDLVVQVSVRRIDPSGNVDRAPQYYLDRTRIVSLFEYQRPDYFAGCSTTTYSRPIHSSLCVRGHQPQVARIYASRHHHTLVLPVDHGLFCVVFHCRAKCRCIGSDRAVRSSNRQSADGRIRTFGHQQAVARASRCFILTAAERTGFIDRFE